MQIATEDRYEGWYITTDCRENKPIDWKPFDPIPYAARAHLQLLHRDQFKQGWVATTTRSIPEVGERHFDNWPDAHAILKAEARALIDTLKK